MQLALTSAGIAVTVGTIGVGDYSITFTANGVQDPLKAVGSPENRIDVDVIANALGTGKVFYNGTLAGLSGSPRGPPTGFKVIDLRRSGRTLTAAPTGS